MTLKEALVFHDSHETLWLLEKATGLTSTQLRLANESTILNPEAEKLFLHMIEQRCRHVPLQYILGCWDFMGLPMKCRPGVLIPRGDTEVLAQEAIKFLNHCPGNMTALDICTGSGCVGIGIAKFCPKVHVTAVDIDVSALALAEENAVNNAVGDRISFVRSDLFEKINSQFNCITSNPPYIPTHEIISLSKEVQQEPVLALDGGKDGLDFYRTIIPACRKYLLPGGGVFLEIGNTQGEIVMEMMHSHGFNNVAIVNDIEGRPRVVQAML